MSGWDLFDRITLTAQRGRPLARPPRRLYVVAVMVLSVIAVGWFAGAGGVLAPLLVPTS